MLVQEMIQNESILMHERRQKLPLTELFTRTQLKSTLRVKDKHRISYSSQEHNDYLTFKAPVTI